MKALGHFGMLRTKLLGQDNVRSTIYLNRMIKMRKLAISLLVVFCITSAYSNEVETSSTLSARINTYSDYGSGDALIRFSTGVSACNEGVVIKGTDIGKNTIMSVFLTSLTAGKPVKFWVENSQFWAGSGTHYCVVKSITVDY